MRGLPAIRSVHGGIQAPWRTLTLSFLALVLYLSAGPAPETLVYDRTAIAGGDWWRLITGHLVHSDAEHALWDIAALALFGALFEGRLGGRVIASLALGILAIDAWLWWAMPELLLYCGLSGLVNALIAAGLWRLWEDSRDPLILWIGLAALAKIGLETVAGSALFTHTAWPGIPEVHAVGFAAGFAAALIAFPRSAWERCLCRSSGRQVA
ncbi:MAG: rhombosortase [Chromatiaceae bacterium]|nr:rhombosortase [Chromatiaceae bacterium]